MGLVSSIAMRKQVKHYRKFFNAQIRRAKIVAQGKIPTSPAQLHMAVMAAICDINEAQPSQIIQKVFCAGLDSDNNPVYQKFITFGAQDAFWAMVHQGTGYYAKDGNIKQLAVHLLLTASTRTISPEHLTNLEKFLSLSHQAYCYDFVSDWLRNKDNQQLYEIARYVEEEVNLLKKFNQLTLEDLVNTECFPCIHEIILTKLMTEINNQIINVDNITK